MSEKTETTQATTEEIHDGDAHTINVQVLSRTFLHKIEAKNQGCHLSMDTSVFGVFKTYLIFTKLLKMPRTEHKRNWERVAVVDFLIEWWLLKEPFVSSSVYRRILLSKRFSTINFHFTQTTKHQHTRNLHSSTQLFAVTSVASHFSAILSAMCDKVSQNLWVLRLFFTT